MHLGVCRWSHNLDVQLPRREAAWTHIHLSPPETRGTRVFQSVVSIPMWSSFYPANCHGALLFNHGHVPFYSSRLLFPQPDTQTLHRSCKCTPPWYRDRMYLMQHAARRDLCISVDICSVARRPRLAEDAAYLLVLQPVASPSNNTTTTTTTTITAPHDAATRSPHGSSQTSCRRNTQHNINIGGYARTPALDPRSPRLRLSIALP
jgi:hypothetical protein